MKTLRVDVWSDVACPWCYVGKRRLEAALHRVPFREHVTLVWRAFELDPSAPRERRQDVPHVNLLAAKYRVSVASAQQMIDRLVQTARTDGLEMHFEHIRPGNTFDAHRVLHLARDRGVQDAVKEAFFRGYFTEGRAIGEAEVLVELAAQAGLNAQETRGVLDSAAYAQDVRTDEQEARELGITGVPFFAVAGRFGVSGAQPPEVLVQVLTRAWEEIADARVGDAAACGVDGCN